MSTNPTVAKAGGTYERMAEAIDAKFAADEKARRDNANVSAQPPASLKAGIAATYDPPKEDA